MTSNPNQFFDCFVSYRRTGGSDVASLIKMALEERYGFSMFLDVDSLPGGRFDERLLNTIRRSTNFILVLAPGSLDRCKNEGDWLRREIATAIDAGVNIIPVLTNGFAFPNEDELPSDIRAVVKFNGVRYVHEFRDASIARIASFFVKNGKRITTEELVRLSDAAKARSGSSATPTARKHVSSSIMLLSAVLLSVLLATLAIVFLPSFFARNSPAQPTAEPAAAPVAHPVEPRASGSSLTIQTTPPGARACLDGKEIKITPATFTNLEKREYTLTLGADGYEPVETKIMAGKVDYEELPVYTLVRSVGSLEISSGNVPVRWEMVSVPADAVKMSAMTPNSLSSIPTGDYVIRFLREGWLPCTENVNVSRNGAARVSHSYSDCAIHIDSNAPGVGWRIVSAPPEMDRNSAAVPQSGKVPAVLSGIPSGVYEIVFSRGGWPDESVRASAAPDKQTDVVWSYPSASMEFVSNAKDVRWKVTGGAGASGINVREGTVPFALTELASGNYQVQFSRPGWVDVRMEISLRDGEKRQIRHDYDFGNLSILSNGKNVGWSVVSAPDAFSGAVQGAAPSLLRDVPTGRYKIEFRCDGWPSETVEVSVESGGDAQARGEFVGGELRVISDPLGASVYDGTTQSYLGKTPLVLRNLKPGGFTLTLSKAGYKPEQINCMIQSGKSQEAKVTLELPWTTP
jgi:hypothetical protein